MKMEIKDFSMYFSPHMMLQYIIFLNLFSGEIICYRD